MELQIIRHAQAEDESLTGRDADRPLSDRGRQQAKALGGHLASLGRLPEVVLTSPLARARDTAALFCKAGGLDAPLTENWLSPGMRPGEASDELKSYRKFKRVAIVGHQPDLGHLIESLLGCPGGRIRVRKGEVFVIRLTKGLRKGMLEVALPCQYLVA